MMLAGYYLEGKDWSGQTFWFKRQNIMWKASTQLFVWVKVHSSRFSKASFESKPIIFYNLFRVAI